MSSFKDCKHCIQIINFSTADVVTYPIVRLVGLIETKNSSLCQRGDQNILVKLNTGPMELTVQPANNRFRFMIELNEGKNQLHFTYGCKSLEIILDFQPIVTEFTVMPLYVICEGHDGFFQAPSTERNDVESACKRILLCSKLLQCFTAEKLHDNCLGRKTFNLENQCRVFFSKIHYLEARKMSQEELWQNIGRDIMNSEIGSDNKKYLAFLSCTNYNGELFTNTMKTHEELLKITDGYVALGGGGLALFGTACLYTWPECFQDIIFKFEDKSPVNRTRFLDDSCYRGTLGSCFSTTLGSVLHELYHTFNLGHTQNGVMGRGFDNIYKFFLSAHRDEQQEELSMSFQDQIEFKEEFEAEKLSERLIKEHKKKEFNVIRKIEDDDCTILTKSCAVILSFHRWFNILPLHTTYTLTYDSSNNFIKSTAGIRVVELRRNQDEMILFDWIFDGKVLKFSFRIPDEVFTRNNDEFTLFVEDNYGNILKDTIVH